MQLRNLCEHVLQTRSFESRICTGLKRRTKPPNSATRFDVQISDSGTLTGFLGEGCQPLIWTPGHSKWPDRMCMTSILEDASTVVAAETGGTHCVCCALVMQTDHHIAPTTAPTCPLC